MRCTHSKVLGLVAALALSAWAASARDVRAAEAKPPAADGVIPILALSATIQRVGGRGLLTIEAELDVADAKLHSRAVASMPRLRDAYLRFVTIYAAAIPHGSPADPDEVGSQLQRLTDRVLGRAGARLLLGSMVVN